jgi:cyclopropane fatty-acyl-phospholipid synthase-like methyltransferase
MKKSEIKENYIATLQHWAEFFKSNDDDYADDIAYLLLDKAQELIDE